MRTAGAATLRDGRSALLRRRPSSFVKPKLLATHWRFLRTLNSGPAPTYRHFPMGREPRPSTFVVYRASAALQDICSLLLPSAGTSASSTVTRLRCKVRSAGFWRIYAPGSDDAARFDSGGNLAQGAFPRPRINSMMLAIAQTKNRHNRQSRLVESFDCRLSCDRR